MIDIVNGSSTPNVDRRPLVRRERPVQPLEQVAVERVRHGERGRDRDAGR